jgi:2-keto-4-pentenoate hydratase
MSSPSEDVDAIGRGLAGMLAQRRQLIESGRTSLGWKAAFGAPSSLQRLGLAGPLVGYMTDASVVASGSEVDITGWTRAVAEPELAVYLGADVAAGSDEKVTAEAISAIGPAIELADIDRPPDDLESAIAGNIFHKAVVIGERDRTRSRGDLGGLEATILRDGAALAVTARLEELTGRLVGVLARLASLLADHGEVMRAGQLVICGSIVPPIEVAPGSSVELRLGKLPAISVRLT